ncbi:unnamed protein product [Prunus armeniaca]
MACRRFGIFCSSLHSNYSKPVIYPIGRLMRSKIRVVCTDLGIKLRRLYPYRAIMTCFPSHEYHSVAPTAGQRAGDSFAGDEHVNKLPIKSICLCQGHAELVSYCSSSALLDELTRKNSDMADKLSNKPIRHNARMYEIKESMFALKSSLGQKDGTVPFHVAPIKDEYDELLYVDVLSAQSEQINTIDVGAVEEHMVDEAAVEEDGTKDGAVDEVGADAKELVVRAAEQMVVIE